MNRRPRLRVSTRGRLRLPEIALAPGPTAEGVAGDGSLGALFGTPWALLWDTSVTELMLARETGGVWVEVEPLSPLPALSTAARHISLAFDRSARPVIAWHVDSSTYVRQYDVTSSAYVVRGPFAGVDPALVFDALASETLSGADVVLTMLSADRGRLVARIERDIYGVEYELATLPAPIAGSAWFLDQVTILEHQLQFVIASDGIDPATSDLPRAEWQLERLTYHTGLYPFDGFEASTAAISAVAGRIDATTEVVEAAEASVLDDLALFGRVDATTEVVEAAEASVLDDLAVFGRTDVTTDVIAAAEASAANMTITGRIDDA